MANKLIWIDGDILKDLLFNKSVKYCDIKPTEISKFLKERAKINKDKDGGQDDRR
jgi:hypothetical protein